MKATLFALVAFVLAACGPSNSTTSDSVESDVIDAQMETGDNDTTDGKYPEVDANQTEPEADVAEGEVADDDVGGSDVEAETDEIEGEVSTFACQLDNLCLDDTNTTVDFCEFQEGVGSWCLHVGVDKPVDKDKDGFYHTDVDIEQACQEAGSVNSLSKCMEKLQNWLDGQAGSCWDCNDDDPNIYPTAEELCNGLDDDCDGQTDEECVPVAEPQPEMAEPQPEIVEEVEPIDLGPNFHCQPYDLCLDTTNTTVDFCEFQEGVGSWCLHVGVDKPVDKDKDGFYHTDVDIEQACQEAGSVNSLSKCMEKLQNWLDGQAGSCWDCNDDDPNIYPTAKELYDGLDDDCDGFLAYDECEYPSSGCGLGPSYACQEFQCLLF